jgi:hypothetical protein
MAVMVLPLVWLGGLGEVAQMAEVNLGRLVIGHGAGQAQGVCALAMVSGAILLFSVGHVRSHGDIPAYQPRTGIYRSNGPAAAWVRTHRRSAGYRCERQRE